MLTPEEEKKIHDGVEAMRPLIEAAAARPKFIAGIGEDVFVADVKREPKWITCPDCLGNKYLTVIMGDETRHTIDCSRCSRGWEPPIGKIETFTEEVSARQATITGVEQRQEKGLVRARYHVGCWIFDDDRVFKTKEEALIGAEAIRQEHLAYEKERVTSKEKDGKTWAWNVRYYREQIKNGHEQVKRYTEKLEAAKQHVKENK